VEEKLSLPVSDPLGGEPTALQTVLKAFEKDFGLKFFVSEKAFQDAGVANINARLVSRPRVNKVPLGDVLRRILAQVDAGYRIVEARILVSPAAGRRPWVAAVTRWRAGVAVLLLALVGLPLGLPVARLLGESDAWRSWEDARRIAALGRNTLLLLAGT